MFPRVELYVWMLIAEMQYPVCYWL